MLRTIIDYMRASVLYLQSGNSSESGDYILAKNQIEKASALLGERRNRVSLFEMDLRMADIYSHLSLWDLAHDSVERAKYKIARYKKLSSFDQKYLFDYCDLIIANPDKTHPGPELRLTANDYSKVLARYRRYYPISWR